MGYIKILICSVLVLSCAGGRPYSHSYPRVHPKLLKYVKRFDKYYKQYRHSSLSSTIEVDLKELPQSPHAGGYYSKTRDHTIVNKLNWTLYSERQREMLIFHELGHHILKRGHFWGKDIHFRDGCVKSIMYYQAASESCHKKYRTYYIKELFLTFLP